MTIDEARTHFDFDEWANARYVAVLADLPPAALAEPVVSSFPSLLATFAHLVGAEWIWLRRWKGDHPREAPDWMTDPTLENLRARLAAVQEERAAFLDTLESRDLRRRVDFTLMDGSPRSAAFAAMFLHVVSHSTFHRGQLATLLRQAGAVPPATDRIAFHREREDAGKPA